MKIQISDQNLPYRRGPHDLMVASFVLNHATTYHVGCFCLLLDRNGKLCSDLLYLCTQRLSHTSARVAVIGSIAGNGRFEDIYPNPYEFDLNIKRVDGKDREFVIIHPDSIRKLINRHPEILEKLNV